jgi:hypothetical protein
MLCLSSSWNWAEWRNVPMLNGLSENTSVLTVTTCRGAGMFNLIYPLNCISKIVRNKGHRLEDVYILCLYTVTFRNYNTVRCWSGSVDGRAWDKEEAIPWQALEVHKCFSVRYEPYIHIKSEAISVKDRRGPYLYFLWGTNIFYMWKVTLPRNRTWRCIGVFPMR